MTPSAKTLRTAIVAAIVTASSLTATAAPAQAKSQRGPQFERQARPAQKAPRVSLVARWLKCQIRIVNGGLRPFVVNTTGQTLGVGRKIHWRVEVATGAVHRGTLTLYRPLQAGHSRKLMGSLQAKMRCQASLLAF